jgi:hypothetical protein
MEVEISVLLLLKRVVTSLTGIEPYLLKQTHTLNTVHRQ